MARRADHTREELAGLVVGAAEDLARREGLRGVAMRRIATEIGYAPGSIYSQLPHIAPDALPFRAGRKARPLLALRLQN